MADYGPVANYKEYVGCWHPWVWPYTGNISTLPYRLLWPKDYDSGKSYPLLILVSGGTAASNRLYNPSNTNEFDNEGHIIDESYITVYDPETPGGIYDNSEYEAFVLIPQMSTLAGDENYSQTFDMSSIDMGGYVSSGTIQIRALDDLVAALLDETVVFYSTSDAPAGPVYTELPSVKIDTDRVYMVGFSLGARIAAEAPVIMRDKIAAYIVASGWAIGTPAKNVLDDSLAHYSLKEANDLSRRCECDYHIPAIFTSGETDTFHPFMTEFYASFVAMNQRASKSFNISRIYRPGVGHSSSTFTRLFDLSLYFDPTDSDVQDLVGSEVSPSYVPAVTWLFAQTKPATLTNPYPIAEGDDFSIFGKNILYTYVTKTGEYPVMPKRKASNFPSIQAADTVIQLGTSYYYLDAIETGLRIKRQNLIDPIDNNTAWETTEAEYAIDEVAFLPHGDALSQVGPREQYTARAVLRNSGEIVVLNEKQSTLIRKI